MLDATPSPLRLLSPAPRSSREAPRPQLITAAGSYDGRAIMALAHALAREDVAYAASRGRTRRYKIALRDALRSAWSTAQTQRWCRQRDAELAALPVAHAVILAERTAVLMGIDNDSRMLSELAAIDARALALGVRL